MDYSKLKHDVRLGCLIAVLGAVYVIYTRISIPLPADASSIITTRSIPYLIGGVLFILGCTLAGTSASMIRKYFKEGDCGAPKPLISAGEGKRAALLGAGLILYSLGIAYVGYIVSSVLFTAFVLYIYRVTNKLAFIGVSLAAPALLYAIFVYIIEVQMPEALLI